MMAALSQRVCCDFFDAARCARTPDQEESKKDIFTGFATIGGCTRGSFSLGQLEIWPQKRGGENYHKTFCEKKSGASKNFFEI